MSEEKFASASGCCLVGGDMRKGAKQFQEDSITIWRGERIFVGAVFDGHGGYNGKVAADTAAACIDPFFREQHDQMIDWSEETWTEKLVEFFKLMHDTIRNTFLTDEEILKSAGGAVSSGGFANLRERMKAKGLQKPTGVDGKENGISENISNNKSGIKVDEKGVVRRANGYPVHGGTTATVCVIVIRRDGSKFLITANVGDSDAILILPTNSWSRLSEDHGPDRRSEFLRIQNLDQDSFPTKLLFVYDKDNMYRKYECPQVFLSDGTKDPIFVKDPWGNGLRPTNVRYDPAVYAVTPNGVTTDVTCIAMTRSLADFYAHQFGLSYEPSITFNRFSSEEKFVVAVGSDGIWDCWLYEAFAQAVNTHLPRAASLDEFVASMLNESVSKAKASFGAQNIDDASLVFMTC